MRIERLKMKNFRQFRETEIVLDHKHGRNDLHVFVGVMGTGKSNILNAINWCLFGEEPFLSRKDKQLPLLNTKVLEEAGDGDRYRVGVEIHARAGGRVVSFVRNEEIQVTRNGEEGGPGCFPSGQQLRVVMPDESGNSKIFEGDDAQDKIDLFVPREIKEFFFFDGERLDTYFREATGQKIRKAVHEISQVALLTRTKDHLQKVIAELQKDAGRLSPDIEKIRSEYAQAQQDSQKYGEDIRDCKGQVVSGKQRLRELTTNLQSVPETESLEAEREGFKRRAAEIEGLLRKRVSAKNDLVFSSGIRSLLRPAAERTLSLIADMHAKKELPPTFDRRLLETLLSDSRCICGRSLEPSTPEAECIRALIETIRLSPEVSQRLMTIDGSLHSVVADASAFSKADSEITAEIATLEEGLKETLGRIEAIDGVLGGFDIVRIREWNDERRKLEEALDNCQRRLALLEHYKDDADKRVKRFGDELTVELKKESRVAELKNDISFAEKSVQILHLANRGILDKIRRDIEKRTEDNFMRLHWKKDTYERVVIDEDYTITPVHMLGYDTLGTISGGEREVLALSFSIALHEISGFSAAIVIDRPFAMVSGVTRGHIAEILSRVSSERQVVLLLTPEDYAVDVRGILEPVASTSQRLKLLPGEHELELEES